jgi:Asp-tRNA(Asn)/Glu-tRNA(Gln) amidotransferase A subunit family amidase
MKKINAVMKDYDVVITPSFEGKQLSITNLTGHPALCMPIGFDKQKNPNSITFLANLYQEEDLLLLGKYFQEHTDYDDAHPPMFK